MDMVGVVFQACRWVAGKGWQRGCLGTFSHIPDLTAQHKMHSKFTIYISIIPYIMSKVSLSTNNKHKLQLRIDTDYR
jgi:ribulose-5-phosphate 4-epimerase/fuculose-1-phosphate aldolase